MVTFASRQIARTFSVDRLCFDHDFNGISNVLRGEFKCQGEISLQLFGICFGLRFGH